MSFDLDSYISNYKGTGKVKRLLYIAEVDKELKVEALKKAVKLMKKGTNTVQYQETHSSFKEIL
jgi:hypothetical protein